MLYFSNKVAYWSCSSIEVFVLLNLKGRVLLAVFMLLIHKCYCIFFMSIHHHQFISIPYDGENDRWKLWMGSILTMSSTAAMPTLATIPHTLPFNVFFSFSINVFLMSHWDYKLERYTLTNLHCTVIVHGWIQAYFPEEQFGKSYFALERLCCIYRIIGSICSWGLSDCLHEAKDGERFTGIKALVHQEQLKIHSLRFARWFQAKVKLKLQRTTWSLGLLIILMNTALSCPTFAYSWVFFLP